jgi:hypothetical protein
LLFLSRKDLSSSAPHRFSPAHHLLQLCHAFADDLIHCGFHEGSGDRLSMTVAIAVVCNESAVDRNAFSALIVASALGFPRLRSRVRNRHPVAPAADRGSIPLSDSRQLTPDPGRAHLLIDFLRTRSIHNGRMALFLFSSAAFPGLRCNGRSRKFNLENWQGGFRGHSPGSEVHLDVDALLCYASALFVGHSSEAE